MYKICDNDILSLDSLANGTIKSVKVDLVPEDNSCKWI